MKILISTLFLSIVILTSPCLADLPTAQLTIHHKELPLNSSVAFYHPLPLGQEGPVLEMAFFHERLNNREATALQKVVSVGSAKAVKRKIGKSPRLHLSIFFKEGSQSCELENVKLAFLTIFTNPDAPYPKHGVTLSYSGEELERLPGLSSIDCNLAAGQPVAVNWNGDSREISWEITSNSRLVHQ